MLVRYLLCSIACLSSSKAWYLHCSFHITDFLFMGAFHVVGLNKVFTNLLRGWPPCKDCKALYFVKHTYIFSQICVIIKQIQLMLLGIIHLCIKMRQIKGASEHLNTSDIKNYSKRFSSKFLMKRKLQSYKLKTGKKCLFMSPQENCANSFSK